MSQLTLVSFPSPASTKCCLFLAASYSACQKHHVESLIDLWSLSPGPDLCGSKKYILSQMAMQAL